MTDRKIERLRSLGAQGTSQKSRVSPEAAPSASGGRYSVLSSWNDRRGDLINMRRGYYNTATDSGFGWWKITEKHNLTINAVRAGTSSTPHRSHVSGKKYNYETPVYKIKCSGWGPFKRCKKVDETLLVTGVDFRVPKGLKSHFGVVTSFCRGYVGPCPNWVKEAANI